MLFHEKCEKFQNIAITLRKALDSNKMCLKLFLMFYVLKKAVDDFKNTAFFQMQIQLFLDRYITFLCMKCVSSYFDENGRLIVLANLFSKKSEKTKI